MKKTNMTILDEVKARMKEMQDSKAAQLETIRQKQEEASTKLEAAELAMKQATEEMNVDSYEAAKNQKHKAQTALDMFNTRYNQIKQQEYISEADSDKVIDSLLEHENQLAEDFKAAAGVQLKKLAELLNAYKVAVKDTEDTLTLWQRDIHRNYRSSTSYRLDPVTGKNTNRMDKSVPVHSFPYTGCNEAKQLGEYLKTAAALLE